MSTSRSVRPEGAEPSTTTPLTRGTVSAPPKEREDARELLDAGGTRIPLLHVPSLDGIHGLCGYKLRKTGAVVWLACGPDCCVVCDSIYDGLPRDTQAAICWFARSAP